MTLKPVETLTPGMEQGLLLRAIESQVIPRLLLTHPSAPEAVPATVESGSESVRPAAAEVVEFTEIVLRGHTEAASAFMRDLRAVIYARTGREQAQRARPIFWGSSGRRFKSCQPDQVRGCFGLALEGHLGPIWDQIPSR